MFKYPGAPGKRHATGMQQLIARGMEMLREHAPEIATQAQTALDRYKPQMEQMAARGTAYREFRQGARTEVREGLKAGKSAADIKAGLADNISAFSTAWKPKDAAKFNERVTAGVSRRVDRRSARYARRHPKPPTGGTA